MSPTMVDTEKQEPKRRAPSVVRCTVLTCATVAFVSLCACVVLYERDALSPERFANVVVVVDYPEEDGRRPSSPSVRVEVKAFDAPGSSARRYGDAAPSPSLLVAKDEDTKDTNAISTSFDDEKFDAAYDVAPPVAKEDVVEKFGILLQTLMNRPGAGFDNPFPHLRNAENVDVVMFVSDPANGQQSGVVPIDDRRMSALSQSVRSPIDIFNSLVRGQYDRGMEPQEAAAWSPMLQQRRDDMEMFFGATDGEDQRFESLLPAPIEHMLAEQRMLARQHMLAEQHVCPEHNMLPEEHVWPTQHVLQTGMLPQLVSLPEPVLRSLHMLPEQQIVPELELLPEQNMLPEQQIYPEQPVVDVFITETEKPAVETIITEMEQPDVKVVSTETKQPDVDVVSTESDVVNKLLIAVPVMRVKYEEITVSSPHSSPEGTEQAYEDKPLTGQIDPESVESDNSSRPVSIDDAEQLNVNESASVSSSSSPEVEMQSVQIDENEGDEFAMPAVRADYKMNASNDGGEVNVAMTGAVPVPRLPFENFWQDIMKIFSMNARPIST